MERIHTFTQALSQPHGEGSALFESKTHEEGSAPFTNPFCYEPHPLCIAAAEEVKTYLAQHPEWSEEISRGKMFGVLVVSNNGVTTPPPCGEAGRGSVFLAAFSGLLDGKNDIPYFVPPIYDLLEPSGHFQQEQNEITAINHRILQLEHDGCVNHYPEAYNLDERQIIVSLRRERKLRSIALQDWLFDQYVCLNAKGEEKTITDIFLDYYRQTMLHVERFEDNAKKHHIPSGTGECCAPKLLQYAYRHGFQPLYIAEWWMGASPKDEVRHEGQFYPACSKKCGPLLHFMLQGLDVEESFLERHNSELLQQIRILYEDETLLVIDKPSGLLSVPGRDRQVSVLDWVAFHRTTTASSPSSCESQPSSFFPAHRLDQDTSGVLILAKNKEALASLQEQFHQHKVRKKYIALLDGAPKEKEGTIVLPLAKDPNDPPRQRVDYEHGKRSVTKFKVIEISQEGIYAPPSQGGERGRVHRVEFYPETGRTHQLRVHAAHADGLNCPIVGDKLYGRRVFTSPRLMLHAAEIDFVHPVTGQPMHIESSCPF